MNRKLIFLAGIIPLMVSCVGVYFSTPQPVDSKNIYSFPEKFRGVWTVEEATVSIEKKFFRSVEISERRISRKEFDTSSYLLKNNKIYDIIKEKSQLSRGFPYEVLNDSIVYQEPEEFEILLGKNAFLRKVKKNYILNVKQEDQWWEIVLLKKDNTGKILVCLLDTDDIKQLSTYEHIYTFKSENSRFDYMEASWTKKELLEMIDSGVFSDTLLILDPADRIREKKFY